MECELYLTSGYCKFGGGDVNFWTDFAKVNNAGLTSLYVDVFLDYYPDYSSYIKAYFDPNIWNTGQFGLLYTDDMFEDELIRLLINSGFPISENDIEYSEQGMQGNTYVHFDISPRWTISSKIINTLKYGLIETYGILM